MNYVPYPLPACSKMRLEVSELALEEREVLAAIRGRGRDCGESQGEDSMAVITRLSLVG